MTGNVRECQSVLGKSTHTENVRVYWECPRILGMLGMSTHTENVHVYWEWPCTDAYGTVNVDRECSRILGMFTCTGIQRSKISCLHTSCSIMYNAYPQNIGS